MDRASAVELPEPVFEDRDQKVVLRGISWEHYDALLRARGEAPQPRFAFLDGELEIMTTSTRHEIDKKFLARLVEAFADARNVSLNGIGNATFRKRAKQAGLEPDECYCIGRLRRVPELAIEIVHASGGVDKLEIYRRLGVREVWFWIAGAIWVYRLVGDRFQRRAGSVALKGIDLAEVVRLATSTDGRLQTETVRAYRRKLQRRRSR